MAARVIDAKYSTFIGTPAQIGAALGVLRGGKGAAVVDVKFSNFVVTEKPIDAELIAKALATTPGRQR